MRSVLRVISQLLYFIFSFGSAKPVNKIVVEPIDGSKVYALTATRRLGWLGFGLYRSSPIIELANETEAKAVKRILCDSIRFSSVIVTGTREAIMNRVRGVLPSDFGKANSVKDHITKQAIAALRNSIADLENPQSVFLNWLSIQIQKDTIQQIDGYHFTQKSPRAKTEALTKLEQFLPAYYNSYVLATTKFNLVSFPSIDVFARELLFRATAYAMGLVYYASMDDIFPKANAMLKAHSESPELEVVELTNPSDAVRELSRAIS